MIRISELAANVLLEALHKSGVERDKGLRIEPRGNRLVLRLDKPDDHDHIHWYAGSVILIVDPRAQAQIGNATIDVKADLAEPQLVLCKRHSASAFSRDELN